MNVTIHFFTYRSYYRHIFCKSTAIICQLTWLHFSKWTFVTFEQRFCYNHMWSCPVVAYWKQKTKEYVKFLAQKWSRSFKKFNSGLLRESIWNSVWLRNKTKQQQNSLFAKWSLTGGGRLREVVTMRELTVCL